MKLKRLVGLFAAALLIIAGVCACGSENGSYIYEGDNGGVAYKSKSGAELSDDVTDEINTENQKLIREVSLVGETKEFDKLMEELTTKLKALGGYYESYNVESKSYSQDLRYATLTARVPKEKADEYIEAFSGTANVTSHTETQTDVTLQYTDVESKLKAYYEQEKRLLELVATANNLDELLTLEKNLTEVRYQIEGYESVKRKYDNRIEYVKIDLKLNEVQNLTDTTKNPGMFKRMGDGFMETINEIKDNGEDFLVWFVAKTPIIVILALFLVVVILLVKKERKKKKNKNA